jgi:Protein of unknown function (DUF1573)
MKKLFIILTAAVCLVACNSADKKTNGKELTDEQKKSALKDSSNFTTIQWLDSTYKDLGKVKEGTVVEVAYRFKNTGNHNLVVADVTAGCGCTTPDKPQEPIAPGAEGVIKAKFNSQGRVGENRKDVSVTANTSTQNPMILTFRVEVTN